MLARHLHHIVCPFKALLFRGVSREVHPVALTPSVKPLGACAGLCRWMFDPANASTHMEATMKTFMFTLTILVSLLLGACGNYSGAASSPATYTIGGTVSGLFGSGLILQDNGGNNLPVSADATSFTFTTAVASGGAYSVKVLSQPSLQTCAVTSGSGTVTSANVTSVQLTCTNIYTIGGTISGLSGSGLVLQDNGGNNLTVSAGTTSFAFSTGIASGSAFNVTVFSQPSNPTQTCGVTAGASGTVASGSVFSVVVTCTTNTYTIGGAISGLSGSGLILQDNGGNNLPVSADATSFTFTTAVASGGTYSVTVLTQPSNPTQTCGVTAGGNGAVASANVTSAVVSCIDGMPFALTGGMTTARDGHTATLLNNGQVLIAGGTYDGNFDVTASAELYNPATGTFTATGSMTDFREGHTATLLNNGQVLITGGSDDNLGDNVATAELYDPATGTFTATGSMTTARWGQTATLLNNGQVLIAGGVDFFDAITASAELYNPATGTFTATGSMASVRLGHTATLLNNGQVLIAGGTTNYGGTALASAELYDPATGTFTATGSMATARDGHTATLLNNGQVLIAGGIYATATFTASAELYDTATGTFTATGSMTDSRASQTATLLNNGQVLIAGGYEDDFADITATAELYNPATGAFTFGGSMTTARVGHTATLLNNGQVLVAGGNDNTGTVLASAELYLPTTLTPTGLASITVTPTTPTVSVGSTQQFVATGRFSDNSTQILQSVDWSSSNAAAATVTQ